IYMIFFSFAYLSLSAGTGALLLFGSVQLTMFVVALHRGAQLPPLSWVGLALAVFGLVFLLLPGITAPDPTGAVLMTVAGIAWGAYSLLGKRAACVLDATVVSFALAVPLMLIVSLVFRDDFYATRNGVFLAVASGAMASGIGYVIWYAALRGLAETSAATVQLSVPVIAAVGGVILLSEQITLRLLLASVVIIGGITVVLLQRTAGVPGQRVELNNELK
ncbi:MAG: DMT family transporter, partial [Arenicellales bacterium]|nr:DMT family transporter [Arenicellales bacterium]